MKVAIYGDHVIMDTLTAAWARSIGVEPKQVPVRDHHVDAIPHTLEAVTLFRNVGLELATPLRANGYVFPGRLKPYDHQIDTADYLAGYLRAFCLNSPGTGKTASVLWAADFLMKRGAIHRVLVTCPLSCVSSVWSSEAFAVLPHRSCAVMTGTRAQRLKVLASSAEIIVTNHDGVKSMLKELMDTDNGIDLVVVDECTAFKTPGADRTKALIAVSKDRRVWALTGTPIPQNPIDAFVMCKLINPNAPRHAYQFRDATMRKVNTYKWVAKDDAVDKIKEFMQPAIRFDKSDCLDMPAVVFSTREVPLTPVQAKAVKQMKSEWVHDIGSVTITAPNAAVRIGKILQACQGIMIDSATKEVHRLDATPRVQAVIDAVNESASKSLIFASFTGSIAALAQSLRPHMSVAVIDGSVSVHKRTEIINQFQNMADPKVIIAHPKTLSHGVTLTAASTTIWYGPTYSAEIYEQGNNRTDRPGQEHPMRVINLAGTTEERKVFDGLVARIDMQALLLDMYRRVAEGMKENS